LSNNNDVYIARCKSRLWRMRFDCFNCFDYAWLRLCRIAWFDSIIIWLSTIVI